MNRDGFHVIFTCQVKGQFAVCDKCQLFTIGIVGTLAHLVMTWSLRFAPSATLAPMQYLEIPVATVIGFLVFEDFPNGMAAIGIVITILAGLYVIYREHATSKEVLKQASTAG